MIFCIKFGFYIFYVVYYWYMDFLFIVNYYVYKNIYNNIYKCFIIGNFLDFVLYFDMVSLEFFKG